MRKFHVFFGERYFVVNADHAEEYLEHLIFTRLHEDLEILECGRFKEWNSYIEVFDNQSGVLNGGNDGIGSEAS